MILSFASNTKTSVMFLLKFISLRPRLQKSASKIKKGFNCTLSITYCIAEKSIRFSFNFYFKFLTKRPTNRYPTCDTVIAPFCARVLFPLTVEETCFRMRIILGVVLIRSLVYTWCVPGGLRSGSGATW